MVLDGQRSKAEFALAPVARKFINVNPNTVSWIGLIIALLSGIVFYLSGDYDREWLLLVGAILVIVSGYFDALDGKIAKLAGKCSAKGDYLDHVFDRYADVFMIGGIAFCGYWCNPYLGMLALVGVLLTSYMGAQAQAIGAPRLYAGLLGRADRVVLSTLFPLLQLIFGMLGYGWFTFDIGSWTVTINWLTIMMLWFAVVGNLTAIQRAIITWNNLTKMENEKKDQ